MPEYRLAGSFHFFVGTYGPATPLPGEVVPALGRTSYDAFCSACHTLGEYDTAGPLELDLSMRGGELPMVFPGNLPEHQDIQLDSESIQALRVFLNES